MIMAGGVGRRMGIALPKQFAQLGGRSVVERAVDAFDGHEGIDAVAVVVHPDWRERMEAIAEENKWRKLEKIVDGGSERYLSSLHAVEAFAEEAVESNLLLHDAARPLVSAAVIGRVVEALRRWEAVGVGVPSRDTVWTVGSDGEEFIVDQIPERRTMWLAQTPQAFRLRLLREAYQKAASEGFGWATDDCGMVRRYCESTAIHVVEGDELNFKITTAADLARARSYIEEKNDEKQC